jgi:hypothetical protein
VTVPSAAAAVKTDDSVGCHETDVIGDVCQSKLATGVGWRAPALKEETGPVSDAIEGRHEEQEQQRRRTP